MTITEKTFWAAASIWFTPFELSFLKKFFLHDWRGSEANFLGAWCRLGTLMRIKIKSNTMTSRRFLTGMHETVHNSSNAPASVQGRRSEVHKTVAFPFILRKRKCVEDEGEFLELDGVC